jgi:hypothetical protein
MIAEKLCKKHVTTIFQPYNSLHRLKSNLRYPATKGGHMLASDEGLAGVHVRLIQFHTYLRNSGVTLIWVGLVQKLRASDS